MMAHMPLIPMLSVTGSPSREDLIEALEQYRSVGIDQFLIYARSGLELEYMGPEWLTACRHMIEYAAKHDMAVWLYDEYNWPSGKCRGQVIRRSDAFANKKLVAFVDRNFMGVEDPAAPAPEYYWTEISVPLYADLLNPDAVDCFIELTHEVYYREFGEYFGSTIKGVFSDEPSFKYSLSHPVSGNALEVPYYTGLKEDYQATTGRELIPDLEAFLGGNCPPTLWYDYFSLLSKRFCTSYLEKLSTWCDEHGILLTGHLMSEPIPESSILASGKPVDAIRAFSMPGLDEIPSRTRFEQVEWNTFKLIESAMNGPRTEALAELFALGPSDQTMAERRLLVYLVALHGINHFVTAVSALDARGNVEKPYYYNPASPTQPWFPVLGELNRDAAVAASLTRKPATASIALRYPQKLVCANWDPRRQPGVSASYTKLIRAMINAQWEFRLIGDDEMPGDEYQVVLDLREGGQFAEEQSGQTLADIPAVLAFLEENQSRRASLRQADGTLVERVFLKSFDDGTICVTNPSDEYLRDLRLGDIVLDLPPWGVDVLPRESQTFAQTLDLTDMPFAASLDRRNTCRCIFTDNEEVVIEASDDLDVVLALRQYGGVAEIALEGEPVAANATCDCLPIGLKTLYGQTASIHLAAGRHTLRLTNDARDMPYLPLVVLAGPFALGADGTLSSLPAAPQTIAGFSADCLPQYAGVAEFRGTVDLSDCDSLSVAHKDMPIEILVDGETLGARLWAPFCWDVPAAARRADASVEIRVFTSVGPLFADYPAHAVGEQPAWLGDFWPGPKA